MIALHSILLRYGLYVLVIGTACGWYVSTETADRSRLRRLGWVSVAVLFGIGGLLAFLAVDAGTARTANR